MPEPTGLITALILDRPMCLTCIATKGGVVLAAAEAALDRMATVLHREPARSRRQFHREPARCRACGETKRVYSVERPKSWPLAS